MEMNELKVAFRKMKVSTLSELLSQTNRSGITIRRHLKKWRTFTSYNRNGRYYALPDIPQFDKFGLWSHEEIRFSKHGNMSNTIIQLIVKSENGMTAEFISKVLGRGLHSTLSTLTKKRKLSRAKYHGRYVYFSPDSPAMEKQKSEREKLVNRPLITDAVAIAVLVEKIKNPSLGVSDLVSRLRKQGVNVGAEAASDFLTRHNLLKKT